MTGLTPERQLHLTELIQVAGQLDRLHSPAAVEACHDCGDAILDLINGCDCDDSASALGAARKLLAGGAV